MLWRVAQVIVFLLALSVPASLEAGASTTGDEISMENDLMNFLRLALQPAGAAVRLSYAAPCIEISKELVPFPKIAIAPPTRGTLGLKAVKEIFRKEPSTAVEQATNGTIRISIGDVSHALLQAKIPSLELTPLEQYNPMLAIVAAEKTDGVKLLMGKLGVRPAVVVAGYLLNQPGSIAEHLPASVSNVTFDQFLDLIAMRFRGAVVYGACEQPSLFDLHFVPLARATPIWPTSGSE